MVFGVDVRITELSSPAGSVSTYAYGVTEDDGYVLFKQRNGWFSVRYMHGSELLPAGLPRDRVYYEFREDFSLFGASPTELDDATPDYIHVPEEYTRLSREVDAGVHAAWGGTRFERQPRSDALDDVNVALLLAEYPDVSDSTWKQHRQWRAVVEAVDDGWETEGRARAVVGDEYYDALTEHGVKDAVEALANTE